MSESSPHAGSEPVSCSRCGQPADPYPDNGRCGNCQSWLPGNPNRFDKGREDNNSRRSRANWTAKKAREKKIENEARDLVEGYGYKWDEAKPHIRHYALIAMTTKSGQDMDRFTQQINEYRPQPRAGQHEESAPSYSVSLTVGEGGQVENLKESLEYLDELLRD